MRVSKNVRTFRLIGFLFVFCMGGYLTLRLCRVTTDPKPISTGTIPASQQDYPFATMADLIQANVQF